MSKQAKHIAKQINADLASMREQAAPVKERKTFHRASERHGGSVKARNRRDRRHARADLRKWA